MTRPLGLWYLLHDDWLVCDEAFLIFIMVYEAVGLYTSGAGCVQSPSCLPSGFYWNDPTVNQSIESCSYSFTLCRVYIGNDD